MEPTISVVIPTHLREELLERSVKSVVSQTIQPLEILIVDDSNSDKTKALLTLFDKSLVKYVLNSSGKGASSSRNLGAETAKGDFVAFLDDDDEWLPGKLEKQLEKIKSENLDACFSQLRIIYENENLSYKTNAKMVSDPFIEILSENFIGGTISAVVNRELFLRLGKFDERFPAREEYDLWIRILESGAKIGIVEEPLALAYRSFIGRTRISLSINNYITAMEMINEKHSHLIFKNLTKNQRKTRRARQHDFLAAQSVAINLRSYASFFYLKSFFINPTKKSFAGIFLSLFSPKLLIKLRSLMR